MNIIEDAERQTDLQQSSPGTMPRSWEAVSEDQLDLRSFRLQKHCELPTFPAWAEPWLTSEHLLEQGLLLPDFRWEELMSFCAMTLGKVEDFSRVVTIINRPDTWLNMAVLVGMFI